MTLANLAAATFDLARAGLGDGVAASVQVTTDTLAEIVLTGLQPGQAVAIAGSTVTADAEGAVSVPVQAGTATIDISAA